MSTGLLLDSLRVLLVLAALTAAVDVWWQTGLHERRVVSEARRVWRVRALSELEPPSADEIQAELEARERLCLERLVGARERPNQADTDGDEHGRS